LHTMYSGWISVFMAKLLGAVAVPTWAGERVVMLAGLGLLSARGV